MGPQRRLPQVRPLGHDQVQHRSGHIQPIQRRTIGVGDVWQLRRPEHIDRATGLQETRVRQANSSGSHQGDGRSGRVATRTNQREEQRVVGTVQERGLRKTLYNVTVRRSRRPGGYLWAINTHRTQLYTSVPTPVTGAFCA